mmetsp:Transcript_49453/g.97806  ORF Transcript_49453/g.97806 Transcript_49453/m.97806 type:complete len:272 (+) Transcript_49453:53-868(+)
MASHWSLRLRHGGKTLTLKDVPAGASLAALQVLISSETGIPPERQTLKVGVPPEPIREVGPRVELTQAGIQDRETIIVEEQPVATPAPRAPRRARAQVDTSEDFPDSELLPAFDRAIAVAQRHVKEVPEDRHQVWALRKARAALVDSLKQGNNLGIGALHTLTGVGHWVVQQIRKQLEDPEVVGSAEALPAAKRAKAPAPAPTPGDFTWWYVDTKGKPVKERNSAECVGDLGAARYRVCILHSSGRMEKAYLPEAKAPAHCAGAPPTSAAR